MMQLAIQLTMQLDISYSVPVCALSQQKYYI